MSLQTNLVAAFARLVQSCNVLAGRVQPPGGSAGQVLTKTTAADYAAAWQTPAAYPASILLANTPFTNALVTLVSVSVPANTLAAGVRFAFVMSGSVINTTAASNLVLSLLVNGTVVATATVALGTTAFAAPGRGFEAEGLVTFRAVGASGLVQPAITGAVSGLATILSNAAAPVAVNTTAAVTLALQISTSAATSTGTLRQAYTAAIN